MGLLYLSPRDLFQLFLRFWQYALELRQRAETTLRFQLFLRFWWSDVNAL